MSLAKDSRLAVVQLAAPDCGGCVSLPHANTSTHRITYNPGILQGYDVVNIDIGGGSPGSTIVRADPGSGRGGAATVGDHVFAISLQYKLPVLGQYPWAKTKGVNTYRVLQAPLTVDQ
jgi:hypothetical protein